MDDRVFVKRGSRHGPDFFRHEAAGLAWLAAAPGGPRVVEVVGVDDDEIIREEIPAGRATTRAAPRFGRSLAAWLPATSSQLATIGVPANTATWSPWVSLAILAAWTAVATGVALIHHRRQ